MRREVLLILVIIKSSLFGLDYYVGPKGSDQNDGSFMNPFRTLKRASMELKPGDTCYIREGVYREIIRPHRSGEFNNYITYRAYENEKVVLTGSDLLKNWSKKNSDIYYTSMDWSLDGGNQLFLNGKMLSEASWPSAGESPLFAPNKAIVESYNVTNKTVVNSKLPGNDKDWIGAKFRCAGGYQWIYWTGEVVKYDSKSGTITYKDPGYSGDFFSPTKGNPYIIQGVEAALTDKGEWFYDSINKRILIIPPTPDIDNFVIEAKRRNEVIDLQNRSYIKVKGISFYSGTILTDEKSSNILLDSLVGRYISHSYDEWDSENSGVQISGKNNRVLNCDFGYSSGSVLMVKGEDNEIINNYLHHGNYSGLWKGTVDLSGRRQLFSHNTVRYSGRDLITIHQLMESLIQYNDLSKAGMLTMDLGIVYGHNTDFANTQIRNNWIYDNESEHISMGIYFDIASYNPIVYNNVIWNTKDDPIRFNNPAYNALVFNNSSYNTGTTWSFGYFLNRGMHHSRITNNIFNDSIDLPSHVMLDNNIIYKSPPYIKPDKRDFRLKNNPAKIGAYTNVDWEAGCSLDNPPSPLPKYERANIPWMNTISNACFEYGTLESWIKTGSKKAKLIKGNNWGNEWGSKNLHQTGTNLFELELNGASDGIEQIITGLKPNTKYSLSGWLRVSDSKTRIRFGVKNTGLKDISITTRSKNWVRKEIKFKTGTNSNSVKVFIKIDKGSGKAWSDNLTLPLSE